MIRAAKDFVRISVKCIVDLLPNEIFYDTIGYYELALKNLCGNDSRYNKDEIYKIAKELHVNVEDVDNFDDLCELLHKKIAKLTYADFE